MVSLATFKEIALSFPDAEELPHFEKASFRYKKKIFATLASETHIACIKLSEMEQSLFCAFDKTVIYPVNNKWGKQGWTLVNLKKIKKETLIDALTASYNEVVNKKKSKK